MKKKTLFEKIENNTGKSMSFELTTLKPKHEKPLRKKLYV